MGFWNDGMRSPSPTPTRHKSHSSRNGGAYTDGNGSRGGGGGGGGNYNSKSYSYSSSRGYSSRARPRSGFLARIRKFLHDVFDYVRRNPVKVFFLVIMPLITGGTLTRLLGHLGIRLPRSLETLAAGAAQKLGAGGVAGAAGRYFARGGARDFGAGTALPGLSGGGLGEALTTVAGIAKIFL